MADDQNQQPQDQPAAEAPKEEAPAAEEPKTEEAKVLGRQLLRSSSSVASNYRAVCRSRSKNEFFAKLCITVEEADESSLWLELIIESGIFDNNEIRTLLKESYEITSVLSTARKNTN